MERLAEGFSGMANVQSSLFMAKVTEFPLKSMLIRTERSGLLFAALAFPAKAGYLRAMQWERSCIILPTRKK